MTMIQVKRSPNGPLQGYFETAPKVTETDGALVIEADSIYYKQLNEAIDEAIERGVRDITLKNVNGQRYIGTGVVASDLTLKVEGTPGQDLAMLMSGPRIEIFGNAQDGVGNTMDSGTVIVHGSAGDVVGYGMRGGKVFVEGDVGYRVGIHMKEYQKHRPIVVCGGKARDFFGEYMAGGRLILLGMNSRLTGPMVGNFVGTGMHGGVIYIRGTVDPYQCGKEVGVFEASEEDLKEIAPIIEEYCAAFGMSEEEVFSVPFTKLEPISSRPYGNLYASF